MLELPACFNTNNKPFSKTFLGRRVCPTSKRTSNLNNICVNLSSLPILTIITTIKKYPMHLEKEGKEPNSKVINKICTLITVQQLSTYRTIIIITNLTRSPRVVKIMN